MERFSINKLDSFTVRMVEVNDNVSLRRYHGGGNREYGHLVFRVSGRSQPLTIAYIGGTIPILRQIN